MPFDKQRKTPFDKQCKTNEGKEKGKEKNTAEDGAIRLN